MHAAPISGSSATTSARCRNELVTRIGIGTLTSVTQGTWRTRSR
ncbi:Uncharacterised protein [Mycobacterium tuberculosis]|uniref:Uncharacterized protein n=1 Tax=Mycobacterium tuberculosis TaxID=1773 RepID=A0A916LHR3_MYCTX|nr:Uncharacterised protein [Mycobacterium tuberculosis]